MPRRQTRCPDVKQDAQAIEMPRCPARCPGKRDAQMPSEMPRQTKCPDAQRDAQMSHEMPRCHMRCPDVKSVWVWAYCVWASGHIESGHLGISFDIWASHWESGHLVCLGISLGIWAFRLPFAFFAKFCIFW